MAENNIPDGDAPIQFAPGQFGTQLTKPSTVAPDTTQTDTGAQPASPPALLSTSFSSITGGPPKQYVPPPNPVLDGPAGIAAQGRIWDAAKAGFEASRPDILPDTGPLSRPALEQYPANRAINLPALDLVRNAIGLLGGAYGGVQQMVKENLDQLRPVTDLVGRLDPTGVGFGTVSGTSPLSNAVVSAPDAFAGTPSIFSDITESHPGIPFRQDPVIGVRNAAAALDRGHIGFENLKQSDMTFDPDFVDEGIDKIVPEDAQAIARAKMAGPSAVPDQQAALQLFKGQPMSIQQYRGMMQGLQDAIGDEYSRNGVTTAGQKLQEMRHQLQQHFESANADDLATGSADDLGTFLDANKSTTQGLKMQDMENMWNKASGTENPTASMKTQMNNYLDNDAKTRGWSDDEIAAAKSAGERGAWGTVYYGLGSGLAKTAGTFLGGVLASSKDYGPLGVGAGMALGNAAANIATQPARFLANRVAMSRLQQALDVLGQSVPARPLRLPEADPGSVPPPAQPQAAPTPQPAWGAWDNSP